MSYAPKYGVSSGAATPSGLFVFENVTTALTLEPWHFYLVDGEQELTFPEASESNDSDQIIVKVNNGHINGVNLFPGAGTTLEIDPNANDIYNGRAYTWIYDASATTWRIASYYAGQTAP